MEPLYDAEGNMLSNKLRAEAASIFSITMFENKISKLLWLYLGSAFQNVDVTSTFWLLKDTLSSVHVWRVLKDMVDVDVTLT